MSSATSTWSRLREARFVRVLLVYLAVCWPVLEATAFLRDEFQLPRWVVPLAMVLLLIGLIVILATAWVQSHPLAAARAKAEEIPTSWEIDLGDMRESVARGRLPHLTWARVLLAGAIAFSLLIGLAGLYVLLKDEGRSFTPGEAKAEAADPGIAVLPFAVSGSGTEELHEGMVDLLSTNLDGVAGLRAIDSRTVLARWGEVVQGEGEPDLRTALEVARRAGARYALVGNAVTVGPQVRLAADMYEVESGAKLGHAQAEGSPDSMLGLVDRLSIEVLRAIPRSAGEGLPAVDLASITTTSLPALRSYLEGEARLRRSEFTEAIAAFQRAVEADSSFALAFYRLGTAYGWTEGLDDTHLRYVQRAAERAGRLPEREAMLVRVELAIAGGDRKVVELANEAVQKYPEDAEAWYLLGDAYFHWGFLTLQSREKGDEAFAKAIELDASFTPAHIHLIQNVFTYAADSARSAALIEAYGRLAEATDYDRANRLAFSLVFGDSASRARALARLDSLPAGAIQHVIAYLGHPRALPAQAELAAAARRSRNPAAQVGGTIGLIFTELARGRLQEFLELLKDPRIPGEVRAAGLFAAYAMEMPVPEDLLERGLSLETGDTVHVGEVLFAGLYAADRGRWADHAEAVARLEREAPRSRAAGDSVKARLAEATARMLQSSELAHRGRVDEAVRQLEDVRKGVAGSRQWQLVYGVHGMIAEVLFQTDRMREAERYYSSLPPSPWGFYRLGKIYEDLKEWEKARRSYEQFVIGWKDADPELQPRVAEAKAAIARLSSVIQE
jgi:tetratricopeptide (TPR) repeat protein